MKQLRYVSAKVVPGLLLGVLMFTLGACGDESDSGKDTTSNGEDGVGDNDIADASTAGDGSTLDSAEQDTTAQVCIPNELPADDFWVVYGLKGRVPGDNFDEFDLFVRGPDGGNPLSPGDPEPLSITSFSLTGQEFQWCQDTEVVPLSCVKGCTVDDSLTWIAVGLPVPNPEWLDENNANYDPAYDCLKSAKEVPNAAKGFTVQLGKLDVNLKAQMIKGAIFANLAHFEFANERMYYSKQVACPGASCIYDIYYRDLSAQGNVNEEFKILTFPPEDDINDSIYKGYFHVSRDGKALTLLNPTIRSQSYYMWENGNLIFLKELCQQKQNEQCIGTGSQYTDRDPVALSPDNKSLVTFTIAESVQRVWKYVSNVAVEPLWSNVVAVPQGSDYNSNACMHMTEDWQFKQVVGLQYHPEGQHVLYLGHSECGAFGTKANTDIMEMPISLIGSGQKIKTGDIRSITQNPRVNGVANIVISTFDVSPSGKTLVFAGTPSVDPKTRQPLGNNNQSTFTDKELYYIGWNGCGKKQITKDVKWEVTTVKAIPPREMN